MDQPYQPPASKPPEPPKKPDKGFNVLLMSGTAWFIAMGVMTFLFSFGSFGNAASHGVPEFLRSAFAEMDEDRAVVAVMGLALISILLSFTSMKSAARALSVAALIFALAMGSIALYLTAMSAL